MIKNNVSALTRGPFFAIIEKLFIILEGKNAYEP